MTLQRPSAAALRAMIDSAGVKGAAEHFGVSKRTIANWRAAYGLKADLQCHKIAPPPAQELRDLYEEGFTAVDIAELYGCCQRTVLKWMIEYGIERRPVGFQVADA